MGVVCDFCGAEIDSDVEYKIITGGQYDINSNITYPMPFVCNYCGRSFCEKHRLPENHCCNKLEEWGKWGSYVHPSVYRTPLFSKSKTTKVNIIGIDNAEKSLTTFQKVLILIATIGFVIALYVAIVH